MQALPVHTLLVAEADDRCFEAWTQAFDADRAHFSLQRARTGIETMAYLAGDAAFADRATYPFPKFLLLDMQIKSHGGFEVLAWLNQQQALRSVPIVVFDSDMEEKQVNLAYCLGANSFLKKPQDPQSHVSWARRVLEYWLKWSVLPGGCW